MQQWNKIVCDENVELVSGIRFNSQGLLADKKCGFPFSSLAADMVKLITEFVNQNLDTNDKALTLDTSMAIYRH